MAKGRIHIGTSGWHYDHWIGRFYPGDLRGAELLPWYARHFDCVEVDSSFYRLPSAGTVAAWRNATPRRFRFAVKANRFITHMKKLKDPADTLPPFVAVLHEFADRLGPVLIQLPPHWRRDCARLAAFLDAWPRRLRVAFEFRDETWLDDRVYKMLHDHDAAFCISDLAGRCSPLAVTARLVYLRLHGPRRAYSGSYDLRRLRKWAERLADWQSAGHDVWCFFDNDENAYAVRDASRLKQMLAPPAILPE